MRAFSLIALSGLAGLWGYYLAVIDGGDLRRPVAVPAVTSDDTSAASLNNRAVQLDREGNLADASAYLDRAHAFRPDDAVIGLNRARQRARVMRRGWGRALALCSLLIGIVVFGGGLWRATRRALDASRLARLTLHGPRWMVVGPDAKRAQLELRFSEPVGGLARRHKPSVVWTCAARNQHMKSNRCVRIKGRQCRIRLEGERLEQLRRYPGDWRCILRLGRTEVGEAGARVA